MRQGYSAAIASRGCRAHQQRPGAGLRQRALPQRRANGRRVGSPSLVIHGSNRLPAALFTRRQIVTIDMLAAVPIAQWWIRRSESQKRQQARRQRYRFRKNPAAYLAELETQCGKLTLPA